MHSRRANVSSTLSIFVLATLASTHLSADAPPDLEARRIVWSGYLDALQKPHKRRAFELSPDGKKLLYLQGHPWPRLMVLSIEDERPVPRIVANAIPFGAARPRFNATSDAVYFTAVTGSASYSPTRASREDLKLQVLEARLSDGTTKKIHPIEELLGSFSVLLDVHPSGSPLLIGRGRGFRGPDLRSAPKPIALLEVPAIGGRATRLGLQTMSDALVRYSRDGHAVEYSNGSADRLDARLLRFDRASRRHETTDIEIGTLGRRAGDRDVDVFQVPHRGSFGWDGFARYAVLDPGGLASELRVARSIAALSPVTSVPLAFRGDRVLLCGGPRDRPRLIVAEITAVEARPAAASSLRAPLALAPELFSRDLSSAGASARPYLIRLRAGLGAFAAGSPKSVRARFRHTKLKRLPVTTFEMRVYEDAGGRIRVERSDEVAPEDDQAPTNKNRPATHVAGFDGETCWIEGRGEAFYRVDAAFLSQAISESSIFRLLLDPAGLGDTNLRFGEPRSLATGASDSRSGWALPFAYVDGFAGELTVREVAGRLEPYEWRTPLMFPSLEIKTQMGIVPDRKLVRFETWREIAGRRIPDRILFDNGYDTFRLELLDIAFPEKLDDKLFRMPGRSKDE